jgi:hypothetical protein
MPPCRAARRCGFRFKEAEANMPYGMLKRFVSDITKL